MVHLYVELFTPNVLIAEEKVSEDDVMFFTENASFTVRISEDKRHKVHFG